MIYRNWSLLSSTVVIWGGVATASLAGIFLFGGKVLSSVPLPSWITCSPDSVPESAPSVHGACFGCSLSAYYWWYEAWIWLMHPWGPGIGLPPAIITNPEP